MQNTTRKEAYQHNQAQIEDFLEIINEEGKKVRWIEHKLMNLKGL